MKTHQQIDERSLALARAVIEKIEADPQRADLARARAVCRRWYQREPAPVFGEWLKILEKPWPEIRGILGDESERGQRLRQSDPFCGILTPKERWAIYRRFRSHDATRS